MIWRNLARLFRSIGFAFRIVVGATVTAAHVAGPVAMAYVGLLIGFLTLWILSLGFIAAKIVSGFVLFAYIGTALAMVCTFILGVAAAPLALVWGVVVGLLNPLPVGGVVRDPRVVGERYTTWVGKLLFWQLLISLYVIATPFDQNLNLVPVLMISLAVVGIGTWLFGSWLTGKFYTGVAIGVAALLTVEIFQPGLLISVRGWIISLFDGSASGLAVYWILIPLILIGGMVRKRVTNTWVKVGAASIQLLAMMALIAWIAVGSGGSSVRKSVSAATGIGSSNESRDLQVGKMPEVKKEEPRILSGDTVKLPYGQDFVLSSGAKKMTFIFKPEGFCLVKGSAVIESASPIHHVDGVMATERLMSAEEHGKKFGGPPCFGSKWNSRANFVGMPFSYTLSAPAGDAVIVAAREGQHFGPDEARK